MADKDQVKPLAPAALRIAVYDDHDDSAAAAALSMGQKKSHRHRKYIKCCGCASALLLILVVTALVLVFTVFRVKEPVLRVESVKMQGLDAAIRGDAKSMTGVVDVSVKNPNVASFRYKNSTTTIYYGGVAVGEGTNPPGVAKARRTHRMNVTVEVKVDKVMGVPRIIKDILSGMLPMNSYTRIGGRVKILKIIQKHVVLTMNCSMTVNLTSHAAQDQHCKQRLSF